MLVMESCITRGRFPCTTLLGIYNSEKNGFCYLWDETNGKKGSDEIGTSLFSYFMNLPPEITKVVTYSDTCAGQNRNQFVMALYIYIILRSPTINTIEVNFMESGHSYLEADSMHSAIEYSKRHRKLYTVGEYRIVIENARHKKEKTQHKEEVKPYDVKVIEFHEVFDLKALTTKFVKNTNFDTSHERIKWLLIKQMKFQKSDPYVVNFKYDCDEDFRQLNVIRTKNRKKYVSHPQLNPNYELVQKYRERLPISTAKYKDLMSLLRSGVIPSSYSDFYRGLQHSSKIKDEVPYHVSEEEEFIIEELLLLLDDF